MKSKCESCEGYRDDCQCIEQRTLEALERIAEALENISTPIYVYQIGQYPPYPQPATIPAAPVYPTNGYQCSACQQWVFGTVHVCPGKFICTTTDPRLPNQCSFTTAAGARCTLSPGHDHAHFTLGS